MPHQTPCPRCGRVGLVRVEHIITGKHASMAYFCGGCDHGWAIPDPKPSPTLKPKSDRRRTKRTNLSR